MSTFTHKGVLITFNGDSANFQAMLGGEQVSAPSLDALKKKIDKQEKETFKKFNILSMYSNTIHEQAVVGIKKTRGGRYSSSQKVFVLENGMDVKQAIPDTPHNRQKMQEYLSMKVQFAEIKKEWDTKMDAVMKSFQSITADQYKPENFTDNNGAE